MALVVVVGTRQWWVETQDNHHLFISSHNMTRINWRTNLITCTIKSVENCL
jgi:hypothetical protein